MTTHPLIPPDLSKITLAVLAGGAGTRMGMPKAHLRVEGRPILAWLIDQFAWPGPTLLVTSPSTAQPPGSDAFHQQAVDPADGIGPLQGVVTALTHSTTSLTAMVTVDMPHIDRTILLDLLGLMREDPSRIGIMSRRASDGPIEPVPAIFHRSAFPWIHERLAGGKRSVHGLCDHPSITAVLAPAHWTEQTWLNLNHPADFRAFSESRGMSIDSNP